MSGLTRLIDLLQLSFEWDFVKSRLDTLQLYLLNSVRKGDTAEVVLACRALTLLSLTLGADSETLFNGATPVLRDLLRNGSKSSSARAAAGEALGFLHFVGSMSDRDTLDAMALLADVMGGATALPEAVATACWEAWGLLASTLPSHQLAGATLDSALPVLVRALDDESVDVKTAAGENIALLIEARQEQEAERAEEEGDEEEEKVGAGAAEQKGGETPMSDASGASPPPAKKRKAPAAAASSSSSSSGSGVDMDALIAKLSALATESSRFRGKKERATQRKSFRDILGTVESGEVPEESLKIEKSRHTFSGWSQVKQLAAVRDVLAKGLNTHFVHNETLAEMFDLLIESGDGVDDPRRKAASRAQSQAKALENFQHRYATTHKHMRALIFGFLLVSGCATVTACTARR